MLVTMQLERDEAMAGSHPQLCILQDASDATQPGFGELFAPGIGERDRMAWGQCEEEFEVFAIGECGAEGCFRFPGVEQFGCAADGDGFCEQFGAAVAGVEQVWGVAGESVADVDHGGYWEVLGEPAGFGQAGSKVEVVEGLEGAAEFTGDEDGVAGLGAAAEDAFIFGAPAEEGDRDEGVLGAGGGFAAGDRDVA